MLTARLPGKVSSNAEQKEGCCLIGLDVFPCLSGFLDLSSDPWHKEQGLVQSNLGALGGRTSSGLSLRGLQDATECPACEHSFAVCL